MPHLVQILLPVYDSAGQRFPTGHYNEVRVKLTKKFLGLTAYTRAPAEGLWESGTTVKRDDIIAVEIMVDSLERAWWKAYRRELEHLFHQDEIVLRGPTVRASLIEQGWLRGGRSPPLSTDAPNDPPLRGYATAFFGRWSVADPLVGSSAAGCNGISEPTSGTHGFYPVYSARTGD
jgi:hypothetical protein